MEIAQHIRIFDKMPTDELVEKRTTAINSLTEKYEGVDTVEKLLQLAADLTKGVAKGGSLPEPRITEIESVIRDTSSSFVRERQELQILTCALVAALKLLTEAIPTSGLWSRRDVLALGLWSGLGFQTPRTEERLEALRSELLLVARNLVHRSATNARVRQEVPAVNLKMPEAYDAKSIAKAVQSSADPAIDCVATKCGSRPRGNRSSLVGSKRVEQICGEIFLQHEPDVCDDRRWIRGRNYGTPHSRRRTQASRAPASQAGSDRNYAGRA